MIVGELQIELMANIARLSADMRRAEGIVGQATGAMARAAGIAKVALGAMAGALSIGAFASVIKGAADASAGLHDMSIQTGASVASLMAFQGVAATTDTTIEDIGKAMNRFSKSMASADEESKGIGQAVQSIGLDFNALKAMAPEQQMLAIAKALDSTENSARRSTVAMAFYGKEGAAMLPYLGDLAAQSGDVTAKLTAQEIATQKAAAALADDFGDNLAKINKLGNDWARDLSNGMMPALVAVTGEILRAAEGASGFGAAIRQASADGTVAAWTREIIDGLKKVIAAVEPAAKITAVYFGLFVAAPAAIAATVAAMTPLIHAMAVYAMNVAIGQANTVGFNTVLFGTSVSAQLAAGSLTKLGLAANVLFAAFAGWQIGTYLDEQFIQARIAGEVMAGALVEGWENVKYAATMTWEAVKYSFAGIIRGMKTMFSDFVGGVGAGLTKIGATETGRGIIAYADSLRNAAGDQKNFTDATKALRAEHEKNLNVIGMVTKSRIDAALKENMLSEATRGSAAAATKSTKAAAAAADTTATSAAATADLTKALNEAADFEEKYAAALGMTAGLLANRVKDAEAEAARNEELARTYGMTKLAIEQEELARLEGQLAQRNTLGLNETEIATLEALIDARKRSAAALGNVEEMDATKKASDQQLSDQVKLWDSIEKTAHDTFVSIQDGGKNMWARLKESGQNIFFEWLWQMTAKKWIINVGTSMGMTGGVSGMAQAAGGQASGGGIMGMAQSAKAAYDAIAGGFSGIGATLGQGLSTIGNAIGSNSIYSFGQGMQGFSAGGAGSGISGTAAGYGQMAGTAAGYLGGAAIGVYGGRALSNGYAISGSGNGIVNAGTAIGAIVGGPIGAAIGGLIAGAANRLFGMRPKEVLSSDIKGNLTAATGFQGALWENWKQEGGIFRSDKSGSTPTPVSMEMYQSLSDAYKMLRTSTAEFATSIGADATSIATRTDAINIAIGKTEEETQKNITAYFEGIANTMAADLVPSLANFQRAGESASATLQRLAGNYAMVDVALESIGMTMGVVGITSLGARERLIEAAGGLEAFAANTAGFQQNFLTEAERNAPLLKAVTEQLAAMGLAGVDTRDEFKSVVLGLDLTTEAGAKQYGELMKMQAGFAQLYPVLEATTAAVDKLAEINKPYLDQITELERGLMTTGERRAAEIAGMDASTVALYDRVAALNLETAARAKAADEAKSLQDQYEELTMSTAQLADKQRNGLDPSNRARWDEIQALLEQKDANEKAKVAIDAARESAVLFAKSFGDAVMSAMTRAEQSAKAIRDFSASLNLGSLSALDPDARYREAKRLYEMADPADTQAAQAFLQASKDRGADSFYFERDFAAVQSKLAAGAAELDAYAARLPAFYQGMSNPIVPAVAPVFTQSGSMSKSSAQAGSSGMEEVMGKMVDRLDKLEVIATGMTQLADQFDRVSNGGQKLKSEVE